METIKEMQAALDDLRVVYYQRRPPNFRNTSERTAGNAFVLGLHETTGNNEENKPSRKSVCNRPPNAKTPAGYPLT